MNARLPLQALREEYGSDAKSFYSADTFNEMKPPSSEPAYLSSVSNAVYQVCVETLSEKTSWFLCLSWNSVLCLFKEMIACKATSVGHMHVGQVYMPV